MVDIKFTLYTEISKILVNMKESSFVAGYIRPGKAKWGSPQAQVVGYIMDQYESSKTLPFL